MWIPWSGRSTERKVKRCSPGKMAVKMGVCVCILVSLAGPSNWHRMYPSCSGRSQSPVNIDRSNVVFNSRLTTFDIPGYESIPRGAHWRLHNNGRTGEILYLPDLSLCPLRMWSSGHRQTVSTSRDPVLLVLVNPMWRRLPSSPARLLFSRCSLVCLSSFVLEGSTGEKLFLRCCVLVSST